MLRAPIHGQGWNDRRFTRTSGSHFVRAIGLRYDLTLRPAEDRAEVTLTIDERAKDNIWAMRFHIDPKRHAGFEGDGKIEPDGPYVTWTPPETGGRFLALPGLRTARFGPGRADGG